MAEGRKSRPSAVQKDALDEAVIQFRRRELNSQLLSGLQSCCKILDAQCGMRAEQCGKHFGPFLFSWVRLEMKADMVEVTTPLPCRLRTAVRAQVRNRRELAGSCMAVSEA